MKWELNRRTMQMEPKGKSGVDISARQGGFLIEDYDRHIQFMINYSNSKITHTFGCTPDNIKLFNINDARKIANYIKRNGAGRGIDPEFKDFRTYLICNNYSMRTFSVNTYKVKIYISGDDSAECIRNVTKEELDLLQDIEDELSHARYVDFRVIILDKN